MWPRPTSSAVTSGSRSRTPRSLTALNGQRTVEGLTQGTALESGVETATYANGVKTFAASAGYGSGLEFGTGTAYTQVIPLGNVYALIPASPKN